MPSVFSQDTAQPHAQDDVVRINTELVQTGVSVFDKQGRFVDGLKKEDFELRIEGRPVAIDFFENIVAGSHRDRVARTTGNNEPPLPSSVSFRQRTIVFFLDDRHLSLEGVGRTRNTLLDFIDKQMGENDLVAIASASGRIGFLQQFTDNKEVLRAAVARIGHVPYVVSDYRANPGSRMSEYMALTIERRNDNRVFEYFVQDCVRWAPRGVSTQDRGAIRRHCEVEVQNRARQILVEAGEATSGTYYALKTLLESAAQMPGSKLAFFFSDGFLADTGPRGPIGSDQLGPISDRARRAGVVIYTIDARGLGSSGLDATGNMVSDSSGFLDSAKAREVAASQDALNALAVDTGGRALRNQNTFDHFINEALEETSRYYLIAWRPAASEEKNERLRRFEISVINRPELTVRSARGFLNNTAIRAATSKPDKVAKQPTSTDLRHALSEFYPRHALPLQLSLTYLDTPANGTVLTSSIQASAHVLSYGTEDKEPAELNIAGVVLNDEGKIATSFKTDLTVDPASASDRRPVIYSHPSPLKPGIYQVRVAARDGRSGVVGSAMQWIVIPDLSMRQLSLSSLLLGIQSVAGKNTAAGRIQWSVDKQFTHGTQLRFITFVYNAKQGASTITDLAAQVHVYKEGKAVMSSPWKKVPVNADVDPARIPFIEEINLGQLPAGRYVLQVTVEDRVAHKSVSQQTVFYVE
ncbi:MAG TPA: VWA domain-containing protein [Pyrinomonadaceae bacterium]|nr:VWA domain-containing protein [Pyrinomonadaceae bacterium]